MGRVCVGLYGLGACAILYLVAGLWCFNPAAAEYVMEDKSPAEGKWFTSVEELRAAVRVDSEARASGRRAEPAWRLVGPAPRQWFKGYQARWPKGHSIMQPWIWCWSVLQGGHFPSLREFVIPGLAEAESAAGQAAVTWRHFLSVPWSGQ